MGNNEVEHRSLVVRVVYIAQLTILRRENEKKKHIGSPRMRYRNIENWIDPETDSGLLFFAQRMDELTFSYTIDSYRAPTMSPPQLAEECLKEIDTARQLGKEAASISHILDEFENRLRSNIVVRDLLSLRLESYLNYDRNSLDDLEKKIRVLSREVSSRSYALKCFNLVEASCAPNNKRDIDFLARETVTALCNFGISTSHINQVVVKHFFRSGPIHGVVSLKPFFQEIFPHHHMFTVLFILESPMEALSPDLLKAFDLALRDEVPGEFKGKKGEKGIRKIGPDETYLVVNDVQAPDKFSAVETAKLQVQRVHDLFGIFHHKETLWLDQSAHTLQACCDNELAKVEVHINTMQYTIDNTPSDAATKLERLIRSIHLPRGPDQEKFYRVVAFHGSSSQSSSIETKIVNIWTSLETMTPSRKNSTIALSVVSGVVPFICLNYFQRLFRTLTFDFVRWDRKCLSKALNAAQASEGADLMEKVFSLVTLRENEEALRGLFTDLKNFELLRYRAYTLNQAFKTPENALKFLHRHQERVTWQIYRIYRARNAIIHTGSTPSNATSLFLNAHDYFDQVFELSCAFCSGSSGYNNYGDAFNFAAWLYEQYVSDLKGAEQFSLETSPRFLWKPPTGPDSIVWLGD